MLAIGISGVNVRRYMNMLLIGDVFDFFEVRGIEISTFTRFEISGALDRELLLKPDPEAGRDFCLWGELRPFVRGIIQAGKRPRDLKLVFTLPMKDALRLHPNASALSLNTRFDGENVTCYTATSQKAFALDKTLDAAWEDYVRRFFGGLGIEFAYD